MLDRLSFKAKLLMICAFMASVSITIGAVSYFGLHRVSGSYEKVTEVSMPNLESLNSMFLSYRSIRINLRSLGLSGLTPAQTKEYLDTVHDQMANYEKYDKQYTSLPFAEGEAELYKKVNDAWLVFKKVGENALTFHNQNTPEAKEKLNHVFLFECPAAARDLHQMRRQNENYCCHRRSQSDSENP